MPTAEEISKALRQPFPDEAIKTRPGGNKTLRYVEGHTVINRLNTATDNQWDFEILDLRSEGTNKMIAHVRLHIPQLSIKGREHIGIQTLQDKSEDLVKGAVTDALKKAATLFGVGLELYGDDYEATVAAKLAARAASPRGRLAEALKANGVTTKREVEKRSTERFGVTFDQLTDEQMDEWRAELDRTESVPF